MWTPPKGNVENTEIIIWFFWFGLNPYKERRKNQNSRLEKPNEKFNWIIQITSLLYSSFLISFPKFIMNVLFFEKMFNVLYLKKIIIVIQSCLFHYDLTGFLKR